MRVKLKKTELDTLFEAVRKSFRWQDIAKILNVSQRNLRDWRVGKISLPSEAFEKCLELSLLPKEIFHPTFLEDKWHIFTAASKGGKNRMKLYGNLGTFEGRRKGGLASLKTHQKRKTGFNILKKIVLPQESEELAELLGILVGDGHLSNYQVTMTTNSETDKSHALFVQDLIQRLFRVPAKVTVRKNGNIVNVVASSKSLVSVLHDRGMPIGNKIKNNLVVPEWVAKNTLYRKAFLRGLFDTDGCIYVDKHKVGVKTYEYMGWTITSYADTLVAGVIDILRSLGFNPSHQVSQHSIFIRRQAEVHKYFSEIGTSNDKHRNRYISFCGGVPKRS